MEQVARALLVVSLLAAGLLVVSGPIYGFDVPRLGVIATTLVTAAVLLVPRVPGLLRESTRTEQVVLGASAAFTLWIVLVTLLGAVPVLSWLGQQSRFVGGVALAAPVLLVLVVPALTPSRAQIDQLLGLLAAVLAAGSLYALVQYAGLDPMPWAVERGGLPVGFYGNTNFVGAVLCLATPMAWWVWTRGRNWRIPAAALAVASWIAMYAAGVRLGGIAALGGAVVIGIGLLGLSDRRIQGWFLAAVPVGGVLAGSAAVAFGAAIGDGNGLARVSFWRTAVRMWGDAPLVGQGVGRFEPQYRLFRAPAEVTALGVTDRDLPVDTSHNLLLDLAATAGTPAALLWLTVLVATGLLLRQGWLSTDRSTRVRFLVLAAALGAHGVQSSISVPIITTVYLGWLLIGLTVAASMAARRSNDTRRPARRTRKTARGRKSRGRGQATASRTDVVVGVLAAAAAIGIAVPAFSVWLTTDDVGTATSALAQNRSDIALTRASAAAERSPWWPEVWHMTSRAARREGETGLAREAAERAIAADPLDRQGRYLLVEIDRSEDLDAVSQHLSALRELDPNGLDLHFDVLRYARDVGDDQLANEAADVIERVIDEDHSRWEQFEALRAG